MVREHGSSLPAGWIALGVVAVGIGGGVLYGLPLGVLCLAGGVLVAIVMLIWGSVQNLTGSTPLSLEEAVSLGAPSAEEERKQSVLRALKDLEYERGVGKISEDDYRELSARYRAEAKALLKALDHDLEPFRNRVIEEVERRVGAPPPKDETKRTAAEPALSEPDADGDAGPDSSREAPAVEAADAEASSRGAASTDDARVSCPECSARNEVDAKFCKGCGGKLGEADA